MVGNLEFKTCEVAKDYTTEARQQNLETQSAAKTEKETETKSSRQQERSWAAAAGTSEATFTP
jgi:hypothetical protein